MQILAQQQNEQIVFQRQATPENCKQDIQFMTLFYPGLSLEQIRNNANTITRNFLTQKLLSTKRSPKQTPLARKSQWKFCEEVQRVITPCEIFGQRGCGWFLIDWLERKEI
ncbi:Hypothetical_protein [Hexamita inflata]|uniref:Hypothetical_protein n=1 Tax=Hexamita inflata TaxID=28002 RepID=A0AA86UPC5_9EUKA|nr:Hypothetical protein HINF_LOCUS33828 [Hexamita inflata]